MIPQDKNKSGNQYCAGFTLIEVALAVFILGLALTTLIGLQTRIVSLYVEERNITKAALYAQYLMSIIESSKVEPEEGTVSEDLDSKLRESGYFEDLPNDSEERDNLRGWKYEMSILKIDVVPFEAPLLRIDLKINWGKEEEADGFSLVYFYYDFNSARKLPIE